MHWKSNIHSVVFISCHKDSALEFIDISHEGNLTEPGEDFLQTYIQQDFKKINHFSNIFKFDKQCQSHIGKLEKQYT